MKKLIGIGIYPLLIGLWIWLTMMNIDRERTVEKFHQEGLKAFDEGSRKMDSAMYYYKLADSVWKRNTYLVDSFRNAIK